MNVVTKKCLYDICVNHKDFLLVDVMNHVFRFAWANHDLSVNINGEDIPTGHIYGFTRFILSLKDNFPNCAILLAFDGYDEDRRKVNSKYKEGRGDHTNFYKDTVVIKDLCSLIEGVYSCYDSSHEADDVINVVSKQVKKLCEKQGCYVNKNIYILSNDKDMYQLVDDSGTVPIHIIRKFGTGKNFMSDAEIVDTQKVKDTFNGVSPENIVKFRAITGDSSDNLKGYFRFRKADAAVIAENYDYSVSKEELQLKKDVKPCASWKRFLPKVLESMDTFRSNYKIMKMKDFDFEITPINSKNYIREISYIVSLIRKYQLNYFMQRVCSGSYSQYRSEVIKEV